MYFEFVLFQKTFFLKALNVLKKNNFGVNVKILRNIRHIRGKAGEGGGVKGPKWWRLIIRGGDAILYSSGVCRGWAHGRDPLLNAPHIIWWLKTQQHSTKKLKNIICLAERIWACQRATLLPSLVTISCHVWLYCIVVLLYMKKSYRRPSKKNPLYATEPSPNENPGYATIVYSIYGESMRTERFTIFFSV